MSDFVIDSTDLPTLQAAAVAMGFWSAAASGFITQGPIPGDPNPMASYFLNIVGVVYVEGVTQPGCWSRLRINGDNPFASGLIAIPGTLTVYPPVKYLSDGVTIDPSYTQPPWGMIA
jgi:hypothetical protein